ncbi:LOW QUALITY PROTEIN: sodium- and chloride-dependent GABA transporter 2-like [Hippocampus comes]|uniref:LOW QUALITY PROTEIN: sodium- and chloride-dependent GABA transporter 2-like n=1 Tax=Hippocampus comes TaxID=109280 RepID=UPI00094E0A17|nr:PREDICTED: LOW QUALITY PROTEIN: sodium- and chloride-dependent GABA transporter 2-like [Hippocampus comes]
MWRKKRRNVLEERGRWSSKVEFLLAVAGNIVGLGNVWRFPYLCYKNGGGAFLVPYLVFAVLCGVPLFLLETTMPGQHTQEGGITCWRKLCPLAEGIGCGGELILLYALMTYMVVLAWTLFYLFSSFKSPLPWSTCDNYWNTGEVHSLSLSLSVVYFTATFPYVMLFILLIRGLTLPGARQGVEFYLLPDPSRLTDPQVWLDAVSQIFFSYSVGVGTLTVLGSYNAPNNNCYKDCFWLCLLNSCTSVVAGFAVFSVLGFMAHEQGVPIAEVAESGPGLAFIAYPQAVAMMPLPRVWSISFFIMLFLLGLDTQFVAMEAVMTSIVDMFPAAMRRRGRREGFLLLFSLTCFLLQLVMITEGGMYVFQIFDYYACNGACVLFLCVFESLAVGWIFGAERLCGIIADMTGQRANPFFKICWRYLTPLLSLGSFIYSLVEYQPLTFNRWYVYPNWAYALGWITAFSSILFVPAWALYKLSTTKGTLSQRLHHLCWPEPPDCSLTLNKGTAQQRIREEDLE